MNYDIDNMSKDELVGLRDKIVSDQIHNLDSNLEFIDSVKPLSEGSTMFGEGTAAPQAPDSFSSSLDDEFDRIFGDQTPVASGSTDSYEMSEEEALDELRSGMSF